MFNNNNNDNNYFIVRYDDFEAFRCESYWLLIRIIILRKLCI